jgi:hypothetical protein
VYLSMDLLGVSGWSRTRGVDREAEGEVEAAAKEEREVAAVVLDGKRLHSIPAFQRGCWSLSRSPAMRCKASALREWRPRRVSTRSR